MNSTSDSPSGRPPPRWPPSAGGRAPDFYFTLVESAEWEAAQGIAAELRASQDERAQAFGALFAAELDVVALGGEGVGLAFNEAIASAADRFELLGDAKGLAYASRLAAYERWASLRWAEAIEKFEAAAVNAERAGIPYLEDDARSRIARAHAMGPTPRPETIQLLEQFIREYADRPLVLAGIRGALARAYAAHGDIEAAREVGDVEAVYLEAGMELEATSAHFTQAWIARSAGDFEEQERLMRRMVERLEELNDRNYLSTSWMELGVCLLELGKDDEAQRALERAREITIPEDVVDVVGLDALEAVLRARRGDLEEAQCWRAVRWPGEETDHVGLRLDTGDAAEV
jgi:tetratricopeptide (TPR) repeat protein